MKLLVKNSIQHVLRLLYNSIRKANILTLAIFILMLFTVTKQRYPTEPPKVDTVRIVEYKYRNPSFLEKGPEEGLEEALNYYGIKHPEIVKAQAVLETGHFSSEVCRGKNNLFGLYDSKNKRYYEFDHWSESVLAYKKYIQNRYKSDSSYYRFLSSIKYASDPNYVREVKKIVKTSKNETNKRAS